MSRSLFLSLMLAAAPGALAQAPAAGMINLACVDSLVAVDQSALAGVFSFIAENDTPNAFADLVVHNKKLLKKWIKKLQKDRKSAGGITAWDQNAVVFALQIYASPLAETLEKPGALKADLLELAKSPVIPLSEITARRKK